MSGNVYGKGTMIVSKTGYDVDLERATLTLGFMGIKDHTFIPRDVFVVSVLLNADELILNPEEEATLIATVLPENADDKSVTWESDGTNVATVDKNGVVTGVSVGEATITVTATDDTLDTIIATCDIIVRVKVTGVTLDEEDITLEPQGTKQLTATLEPESPTIDTLKWASSDDEIATVSSAGLVTAVKDGIAIITVTTDDGGFTASCEVTVETK